MLFCQSGSGQIICSLTFLLFICLRKDHMIFLKWQPCWLSWSQSGGGVISCEYYQWQLPRQKPLQKFSFFLVLCPLAKTKHQKLRQHILAFAARCAFFQKQSVSGQYKHTPEKPTPFRLFVKLRDLLSALNWRLQQ